LSAKDQTDVLARIAAALPEALLAAELIRRGDAVQRLDRPAQETPEPLPPPAPRSLTIDEWCSNRRMSRSTLYAMWRRGEGPKFYRAGRAIRISDEADREWVREAQAA
jgi:predicted DNA-binding transcriptional regulator AlpA